MQPLDRTVFAPLKAYFSGLVRQASKQKKLKKEDFAGIAGVAWRRAFSESNIKSGFRVTGIWPFNRSVFSDDEFSLADTVFSSEPAPAPAPAPAADPVIVLPADPADPVDPADVHLPDAAPAQDAPILVLPADPADPADPVVDLPDPAEMAELAAELAQLPPHPLDESAAPLGSDASVAPAPAAPAAPDGHAGQLSPSIYASLPVASDSVRDALQKRLAITGTMCLTHDDLLVVLKQKEKEAEEEAKQKEMKKAEQARKRALKAAEKEQKLQERERKKKEREEKKKGTRRKKE
eukprot:TRINITY_DN2427_c0_g1_i11.p1 TRINITY_DN2427_c0_g1~~TRINITY_DN2427_c0_g1_i11.p1  ORF type:complete len:293 (+),score=75.73 TRINITY_DN2427_c0_g1_i11:192-1070(+)